MKPIAYARATDTADALRLLGQAPNARFLAGGTNLVDLMREQIEQPEALVDITGLPINRIEERPDGGLRIGVVERVEVSPPTLRKRFREYRSQRQQQKQAQEDHRDGNQNSLHPGGFRGGPDAPRGRRRNQLGRLGRLYFCHRIQSILLPCLPMPAQVAALHM